MHHCPAQDHSCDAISEKQNAFIGGCQIFDNVIIRVLKLDMSKAFNRVEWKFLDEVFSKLGYTSSVIELIMRVFNQCDSPLSSTAKIRVSSRPLGALAKETHSRLSSSSFIPKASPLFSDKPRMPTYYEA